MRRASVRRFDPATELAQEDLRYSNAPLTEAEAAQEKVSGNARLQSLKAMLSR